MKIILSTRNPSKAEQIREIFRGSSFPILTLADIGIEGEAVEDGTTLEENALKKALFAHERAPQLWTMADDTGLFIEAPRVKPQPKMPYSPIFMPDGENQVWAEMTVEYENSISHRGKAFRQARVFLESL